MAQMTGSGSTAFGVFKNHPAGGLVAVPKGFTVLHARTLTKVADVELT
jgi:hypothetical protein